MYALGAPILTARLLEEGQQNGQTENLPDRLGGLHGGNQGNQHIVPEILAHGEHNEHHDHQSDEGNEGCTTGTNCESGGTLKRLSLGKIGLVNDGIDGTGDGVAEHVSKVKKENLVRLTRSAVRTARRR
jgi:hypothetical protein